MSRGTILCCLAALLLFASLTTAASVTEQRRELGRVSSSLRVAERMARAGRTDEAVAAFAEAQQALESAASGLDPKLAENFDRMQQKLQDAHAELTKAGVALPELATVTPTAPEVEEPMDAAAGNAGPPNGRPSFVKHVVPILTQHCGRCHVTGRSGGVSFGTYNALKNGGQIEIGSGAESGLVDAIVSGRMPPNGNVVSPQDVRTLVTWINQGATFDGDDANKPLGQLTATATPAAGTPEAMAPVEPDPATQLSPEELAAERAKLAEQMWRLAVPNDSASQRTTDRFLVVGNVPSASLDTLAQAAEAQTELVLGVFPKVEHPLNAGRLTVFAFAKRFDYSEFGTMVERRSLPAELHGHAKYDAANPYIALETSADDAKSLDRELAVQLATLWVADRGNGRLPEWFTVGAGRAIAARIHKTDPVVRQWQEQLPAALAAQSRSNDFMTGKVAPEMAATLAYGFVDALMKKQGNFDRLIEASAEASDFDQACQKVFDQTSTDLAKMWIMSQQSRRSR